MEFTYLDTAGRPVVYMHARYLVDEHTRTPFQVSYLYSQSEYLRKPAVAVMAILVGFVAQMVYWRTDLSIAGVKSS